METFKTASGILFEAATLSAEEWTQGAYFRAEMVGGVKGVCRCAHGAIQWVGREAGFQEGLRKIVEEYRFEDGVGVAVAVVVAIKVGLVVGVAVGKSKDGTYDGRNLQQWLDHYQDIYPATFNRSLFLAHYYAGRVGLTFGFNDTPGRTHAEVVVKLKEAANLAASEGN